MKAAFVIEHLEEDFWEWCRYEYERIADELARQGATLWITNFGNHQFDHPNVKCSAESCVQLFEMEKVCLLDSEATSVLSPEDANSFEYFLLGGILGNVDEFDFDRTSVLREKGFATRNLGSMQMTTDTAALVASRIVHQGFRFDQLSFIDRPEFKVDENEMLVMNFRYLTREDGSADIDPRVLELAQNERGFDIQDLE